MVNAHQHFFKNLFNVGNIFQRNRAVQELVLLDLVIDDMIHEVIDGFCIGMLEAA